MIISKRLKNGAKLIGLLAAGVSVATGAVLWYAYSKIIREVPEIKRVSDYRPLGVTQILSLENGQTRIMAEFYKERRYLTPYDQIPEKLVKAFLSAEDSTFFEALAQIGEYSKGYIEANEI
jgi:penicillin-binding protein 1A